MDQCGPKHSMRLQNVNICVDGSLMDLRLTPSLLQPSSVNNDENCLLMTTLGMHLLVMHRKLLGDETAVHCLALSYTTTVRSTACTLPQALTAAH